MRAKLLIAVLLTSYLAGCGGDGDGNDSSESKRTDVAPLSAEVITKIAKPALAGRGHPLPELLNQKLDAVDQLLATLAAQSATSTNATGHSTQIEATRRELKTLREDIHREFSGNGKSFKVSAVTLAQIDDRFDRLDAVLASVYNATNAAEEADRAKAARAQLAHWRAPVEDDTGPGTRPVSTLQMDRPMQPQRLTESRIPPEYVSPRRAPSNNVYAFLGNTLLAAVDPTPTEADACLYDKDNGTDLAQTEDVQITQEMRDLAESLGYSPARIYQWVANEINYQPYYGSLKGSVGTLYTKAGGATDQASLLIALLRASNIPARYVKGQIQLLDAAPRALAEQKNSAGPKWLGAKSYDAAMRILMQGRNPNVRGVITSAGAPTQGISFTHVWVEACVAYGNYRGSKIDKTGHRWIPLDPSFKDKTYQADIAVNASFNFSGADGTYMAKRSNALPHEFYENQVSSAIKTLLPYLFNNTLADVPYKGKIVAKEIDILPASLPYEVTQFLSWDANMTAETATLPDIHRYKFNVRVNNQQLMAAPLSLPAMALKRVTLAFDGVSATDKANLNTWRTSAAADNTTPAPCTNSSGQTINVKPVVNVDGTQAGIAPDFGAVQLCKTDNTLDLAVTLAELGSTTCSSTLSGIEGCVNGTDFKNIGAADYHALQGYAFQASDRVIADRVARLTASVTANANALSNLDETEGEFLHIALLKYMRYVTDASKRIGALDGTSGESGNHIGLTASKSKVQYVFDLPFAVYRKGFLMDVPGGRSRSVDLTTGTVNYQNFLLSGYASSAYESYIWQEMARSDAVSTVRGLQFAREKKIEIITNLNSGSWALESPKFTSNSVSAMNYSSDFINSLKTKYIDQGYTVTIPRSQIQYGDWKGGVFVAEKNTLASDNRANVAYVIRGGYAGGYTVSDPTLINDYQSANDNGFRGPAEALSTRFDNATSFLNSTTAADGTNAYISFAGDPVNMVTGNMYHTERDIAIKGRGGLPIVFERSYNSRAPKDGPLGYGWTHSFNHSLRFYGVENSLAKFSWIDGTGGEKFFATASYNTSGASPGSIPCNDNAVLPSPAGVFVQFRRLTNCNYEIREKNGLTYTFDAINGTLTDTHTDIHKSARLLSIKDRNGNTLTLSYTATATCTGTWLCKVTDGLNRSLTFSYTNDRISEIKDWTNRSFQYLYINGNLQTFKNPLAVAGSQNPVTYAYYGTADGVNIDHALKSYTLPKGNGMKFEYYTNGKVFRHTTFPMGETNTFTYNDFRRESTQVNERGFTRRFLFDPYGNPLQIVEENGATHTYTYDPAKPFNRLSSTNPQGLMTEYAYDANGNVTQITPPRGDAVLFSHFNSFNQPGKVRDARGNYTLYQFDTKGNVTNVLALKAGIGAAITPSTYAPVATDLVAWTKNRYDNTDGAPIYGNLTRVTRIRDFTTKAGATLNFIYGEGTKLNVTSVSRSGDKTGDGTIDSTDTSIALGYDDLGRPTTDINSDWYSVTKVYDAADRIVQMTDAVGKLRDIQYDANGNTVDVSLSTSSSLVDRLSARYDGSDRKIAAIDAGGNITAYTYDAAGNVTTITNPDNFRTNVVYDEANRPVKAYDEAGNAVTSARDAAGRVRTVTDPNGNTTTYEYWGKSRDGRLRKITQPAIQGRSDGRAVEYDYDENGNVNSVTERPADGGTARTTLTTFDELNRPTRIAGPTYTDASLGAIRPVTKYTYNNLGALVTIRAGRTSSSNSSSSDSTSLQQTLVFDDFGRKLKETDALDKSWKWTYDVNNNVATQTNGRGQLATYTWGYGHQLLSQSTGTGTTAQVTRYTRNALGQVLVAQNEEVTYSYAYDAAHRLKSQLDGRANKTLSYNWSPGGLLNSVAATDQQPTNYQYDRVGRLNAIIAPNGDKVSLDYDPGGRLLERQIRKTNGAIATDTQYQYNKDNSLAQIVNVANGTTLSQHQYLYDGVGNRSNHAEKINGVTINYIYDYDELNRLVKVRNGSSATQENYVYDPLGNRTKKTVGSPVTKTTAYVFDTTEKTRLLEVHDGSSTGTLQMAFVYDSNGSMTKKCEGGTVTRTSTDCSGSIVSSMTYDRLNQLSQLQKTDYTMRNYGYDPQGRRVRKTGPSTQYFVYNGDDIYSEYSSWTTPTAVYTQGAGVDDPVIRTTLTGVKTYGTANYYHSDGLGSIVGVSNNAGTTTQTRRYDGWGNKLPGATITQSMLYGFTGREPDDAGLTYYRARYYDSSIGRFTQRDPIGMRGGLNLYAYVDNNPINFTDPSGFGPEALLQFLAKGIKVVNQKLSGGVHPKTGIPFNDGFPDFSGVSKASVKIQQTGNNATDFARANKAAGLSETPKGYTWHHVEDGATMQLVPRDIHGATAHSGGAALARTAGVVSTVAAGNAEASGGILGTGISWTDVGEFVIDMLVPAGVGEVGRGSDCVACLAPVTVSGGSQQNLKTVAASNSSVAPYSGNAATGTTKPRSKSGK
ncbi:MAG: RHS repeat-associated core domain-containing protein [Pseudomonadota bacterium]